MDSESVRPTSRAEEHTQYANTAPPPPPDSYPTPGSGVYGAYSQQQPVEGSYAPPRAQPPAQQSYQAPVPNFAKPQQGASRGILRGLGCGVVGVILVILVVVGGLGYGGYVLLSRLGKHATPTTSGVATTVVNGSGNGNTSQTTPTAAPAQSFPLNETLTYSNIDLTLNKAELAQSFPDDNESVSGTLRIDFREANNTSSDIAYDYSIVTRLVMPDQTTIPPDNYKSNGPPANGASADNWLDFPVPTSTSVDQLILRLGTADQAAMNIPLKSGADLSAFQPKKASFTNAPISYGGMNWSLTDATLTWYAGGSQADTGKRYVTISVKVDNTSTSNVSAYWGDYMRLKAGSLTSSPTSNATIPTSFPAGSTGNTGQASFMVPQDVTSFTLILLANSSIGSTKQVTIDFQIQ